MGTVLLIVTAAPAEQPVDWTALTPGRAAKAAPPRCAWAGGSGTFAAKR